jgi:catechol 2,3-dioxygenase-like lactoylglutathione lyase family enzyme
MRFSSGLSEIVLIVSDVPNMARFYRDVVGLEPETDPDDGWAWFWAGEAGQPQVYEAHVEGDVGPCAADPLLDAGQRVFDPELARLVGGNQVDLISSFQVRVLGGSLENPDR